MKLKSINQSGNMALGVIIAIVLTAVVAAGFTYVWQKKQADDKVKSIEQEKTTYQAKADDLQKQLDDQQKTLTDLQEQQKIAEEAAKWQSYISTNHGLSFVYPKDWRVTDNAVADKAHGYTGIGLTPSDMTGDFQWGVHIFKSSDTTVEKLIANMGKQFNDKQVLKEDVVINGVINATKVTVTSEQAAATTPDWYEQSVFFTKGSQIIEVSNGAIKDDRFQKFYESFVIN